VTLQYSGYGLPVLPVIDKRGIVRKVNRGYRENFEIELTIFIRQLLAEDSRCQSQVSFSQFTDV
jgi:hypothetical protein